MKHIKSIREFCICFFFTVVFEDHKEEEYQKPKGSSGIKAFSGTGHTLGGITPAVNTEPLPATEEDAQSLELKAQGNNIKNVL